MEQKTKSRGYIPFIFIIITLVILGFIARGAISKMPLDMTPAVTAPVASNSATSIVHAPNIDINVLIASTTEEQIQGLSGHAPLSTDQGMLFVFSTSSIKSFWMKDMNFSLDIIWIDENKNVLDVASDISPDTYPNIFKSPAPARYVLEVSAGFAEKNKIKKGTALNFDL